MSGNYEEGMPAPGDPRPSSAQTSARIVAGVRVRRWRILAGVGVAAVVAGAVVIMTIGAGSSAGLGAGQPVASAARQSASLSSASAFFTERLSGMTIGNFSSQASGTISGAIWEQRTPPALSAIFRQRQGAAAVRVSVIVTGGAVYVKVQAAHGLPRASGTWASAPIRGMVVWSPFHSALQTTENANPVTQITLLRAAENVRAEGTQVIAGVATTIYTGSFAPRAALRYLQPDERARLDRALGSISGPVRFTVWISKPHQIRKLIEVEIVGGIRLTMVWTGLSYDQPVSITAPRRG